MKLDHFGAKNLSCISVVGIFHLLWIPPDKWLQSQLQRATDSCGGSPNIWRAREAVNGQYLYNKSYQEF